MITEKLFNRLFPTKGLNPRKFNLVRRRDELIAALNKFLPKYGITNARRVRAFLANCGIETDYFKTTIEYASGWAYDISVNPAKARSLGNFKKGDGPRYKGSGLSQTTGGGNFGEVQKVIGRKLGIDVVKNPEILRENIEVAVESACIFWDDHNLNAYADRGQFKQLSGIVNRGDKNKTPLHWEKRKDLYDVLTVVIPDGFSITSPLHTDDQQNQPVQPDSPQDNDSQSHKPVVLTPADSDGDGKTAAANSAPPSLKEIGSTVFLHTPKDTVKNICVVIGGRILIGFLAIWNLGLHGQIFLIALSLIAAAVIIYACIKYAPRLLNWLKQGLDYIFN